MNALKIALACMGATTIVAAGYGQGIAVTIDNQPLRFSGIGPRSVNGRTLVPLRGIFEALGAVVTWNAASQTVGAVKDNIELRLKIGDRIAEVNGRETLLDVPPQIMSGSTMVPLRFVAEALGTEVKWDAATSTVKIYTAGNRPGVDPNPPTGLGGSTDSRAPSIMSFRVNSGSWVRANQDVLITLNGTPGANASFEIPGVTKGSVAMRETTAGTYVGTFRPRGDEAINGASVLGRLEIGGRERLIQAGTNLSIDTIPPGIRNVIPDRARISNPRPTIAVLFDDQNGSGLDPTSVVFRVDGVDQAREAEITDTFVSYTPRTNLSGGAHTVEIQASDKAGNEVRGSWTFTIADVSEMVKSLTHNATSSLEPGDTITVTLKGEEGGRATYSIGKSIADRSMRETSPGVYVGEYVIRKGDIFTNEPVTATLVTKSGSSFTIESPSRIGLNAGPLSAPRITSHADGDRVGETLVLSGKAERGSRIRLRVDYSALALGVLRLNGRVYDRVIEADANGNWTSGEIEISGVAATKGAEYTVTVAAVSAEGRESDPVSIKLRR
ncbi:MAG: copper amine oxidase N-terminal domain-containing protein [Fimbriimonadaceae bacterium]